MEAVAVETLIEKANFHSDVALAIVEAIDITIQAGNFVTVPVLDARFAAFDAKMEARFSALEKSISSVKESLSSVKVWAAILYAGLSITLFGALALDNHYLSNRQDQAIAQVEARSDRRFQQVDAQFQKVDEHFQKVDARFQQVDAHFAQIDVRFQQVDARFQQMEAELKEIRTLLRRAQHRP